VAIQIAKMGKDLSYRVHEEPAQESLNDFAILAESFGFSLPENPTPQDIQKFFLEVEGTPHAAFLAACYIKSMRLACYAVDNIGHYGLSLEHYCHFTSPIRRYIDLVIHRLLLEPTNITRSQLHEICTAASLKERMSARAESEIRTLKKLRLLKKMLSECPNKRFFAIISSVKPHGVFFEVGECMLDGFLHVSELTNDYFEFDDFQNCLIGEHRGHVFRCGDTLVVQCSGVDLILKSASWTLIKNESEFVRRQDRS
jgi:ribonuclease R